MALETKIIIRNALFNVTVAKNHRQAIRSIEAMCDAEDMAVVKDRVEAYLKEAEDDLPEKR